MDELTNPFRPGAGTSPPALLGRDDLIDHFGTTVRRAMAGQPGKSLTPIGLRGVGKTVLSNRFAEIAEYEGLVVGFIEASESGDFRSLLAGRLRKILLGYDNKRKTAKFPGEWPEGFAPLGPLRTRREGLPSPGSATGREGKGREGKARWPWARRTLLAALHRVLTHGRVHTAHGALRR